MLKPAKRSADRTLKRNAFHHLVRVEFVSRRSRKHLNQEIMFFAMHLQVSDILRCLDPSGDAPFARVRLVELLLRSSSTVCEIFAAKQRNSTERGANWDRRIIQRPRRCAKQRNDVQFVRRESVVRCSIQLSYGRKINV